MHTHIHTYTRIHTHKHARAHTNLKDAERLFRLLNEDVDARGQDPHAEVDVLLTLRRHGDGARTQRGVLRA